MGKRTRICFLYVLSKHHPQLTLRKSGTYIGEPGCLGASPDGVLVNGSDNVCGIIEINAKLTVKVACNLCSNFYCYLDDNRQLNLKEILLPCILY